MNNPLDILSNQVKKVQPFALITMGGIDDGAYTVHQSALQSSSTFISGGISSNCEFEFDIKRQNPRLSVIMVDKSVSRTKLILKGFVRLLTKKRNKTKYLYNAFLFNWLYYNGTFLPKFIDQHFTISNILQITNAQPFDLFLKFDIEGAEFLLFDEIHSMQSQINQLSIELHDFGTRHEEILDFINRLKPHLSLVSLNVNPYAGMTNELPNCIEVSLVNNKFLK